MKQILHAFILCTAISFTGCGTTAVAPGNDSIVVNAERTTRIALDTFNTLEKVEYDVYPTLKQVSPEVAIELRKFTNIIRRDSPDWLTTARNVTKAYKANRTEENKASLQSAIAVLEVAISESKKYLLKVQAKPSAQFIPETELIYASL